MKPELVLLKPDSITLAGSKLVADRFEAKFHYAIWFEAGRRPASNQIAQWNLALKLHKRS